MEGEVVVVGVKVDVVDSSCWGIVVSVGIFVVVGAIVVDVAVGVLVVVEAFTMTSPKEAMLGTINLARVR